MSWPRRGSLAILLFGQRRPFFDQAIELLLLVRLLFRQVTRRDGSQGQAFLPESRLNRLDLLLERADLRLQSLDPAAPSRALLLLIRPAGAHRGGGVPP